MVVNPVQTFDSPINRLIDADTSLFFTTEDGQLAVSNGTQAGTLILSSDLGGIDDFLGFNGRFLFDNSELQTELPTGEEPFVSDGSVDGTELLRDINLNNSSTSDQPLDFGRVGDLAYFSAFSEENGVALYRTNGTPENTELVADINPRIDMRNVFGEEFVDFKGSLYFVGDDGENGDEIWNSEGASDTTQSITNFDRNLNISSLTPTTENLYFERSGELWATDGSTEGTRLLLNINPEQLTRVGNNVFFIVRDGTIGRELWTSDGTEEGTRLVEDIRAVDRSSGSPFNDGSNPENLTDVGGRLFFTADDGDIGRELWVSDDGTPENTRRVADLTEGEDSTRFRDNFTEVDGMLYFTKDGDGGDELWQSNGTQAGTFEVEPEEINLGGSTTPEFQNPEQLIEFEDQLYFTGEAYDRNTGDYIPALLTSEDSNTVFRLRNPTVGNHFYTTSAAERDEAIDSGEFDFEGESFTAVDPTAEGAEEVYRFFNESQNVYLYTTSEMERDFIQESESPFAFQGEVFNAYETQVEGSIPIYRFLNTDLSVHFYTPNARERDIVEETLPNYESEGIAYYALPVEDA